MQPDIINLTAMTRIALVFVILVVVVFAVHMLTKSKKFENSPVALPLCCLAALIVGFAGLYASPPAALTRVRSPISSPSRTENLTRLPACSCRRPGANTWTPPWRTAWA